MWILAGIAKTTFRWSFLEKNKGTAIPGAPTAKYEKPYCQIFKTRSTSMETHVYYTGFLQ